MTSHHAIPTMYRGIQFRSRLEARWAIFFDLVEWRWEYEPIDLSGWVPDFALIGKKETTLVEVKPVAGLDEPAAKDACKATRAVLCGDIRYEVLLLGYAWPKTDVMDRKGAVLGIGWMCQWFDESPCWGVAAFHDLGGLGFHHDYQTFNNRITGEYDGAAGSHARGPEDRWRVAGSMVQWRPAS
jgi:hypothetical protein